MTDWDSPETQAAWEGPAFDACVEAGARAYYDWACVNEGEYSRWEDDGTHQEFARSRARVILRAALVAVTTEPCATCEGVELDEWFSCSACGRSGAVEGDPSYAWAAPVVLQAAGVLRPTTLGAPGELVRVAKPARVTEVKPQ